MTPTLTLVIPCYRESDRFEAGPFHRFLDSTPGARLLLVDDGSPDDTLARLREAARLNPDRIGVLALDRNVGKGEAVRRGLLHALNDSPDLVGFWDADLAAPLEAVGDFLRVFETRPAVQWVLGSRWRGLGREVRRSAGRHYAGRGFATLASAVLRLGVYDTQCGAKIFRAGDVLREVLAQPFLSRWIFDVELLARYLASAGVPPNTDEQLYELPLRTWTDPGRSRVRPLDFLVALLDLYRIWRRYPPPGPSTSRPSSSS